jgi:hypothetical protein
MSYRRKIRKKSVTPSFALNITSMTDMFTMLLVFLLQSFAASNVQIDTEQGMSLPLSSSLVNPTRSTQVLVGKNDIKVDGQVVVQLDGGSLKAGDLDPRNKNIIAPLLTTLKEKLEKIEANKIAAAQPKAPVVNTGTPSAKEEPLTDDSLLLQAESSADMAKLEPYFTTISAAGFAKVKLATVVGR